MRRTALASLALAALALFALAAPASAWWSGGYTPACDHPGVIQKIQMKFAYADRHTFHWGVSLRKVTNIYEVPEQIRSRSLINRRYCRGTAWLSDGRKSEVVYLIESRQGFASISYGVQSCLPAFDPWHVYDGWCRSIRP